MPARAMVPWNDEFTYSQKYEVNGVKGGRCSLNGKVGLVQCDAFLTNTYKFTPRHHSSREVHLLPWGTGIVHLAIDRSGLRRKLAATVPGHGGPVRASIKSSRPRVTLALHWRLPQLE